MVQIQGIGSFSASDFDAELRTAQLIFQEASQSAREAQRNMFNSIAQSMEFLQRSRQLGIQKERVDLERQQVESAIMLDQVTRQQRQLDLERKQIEATTRNKAIEKMLLNLSPYQAPGVSMEPVTFPQGPGGPTPDLSAVQNLQPQAPTPGYGETPEGVPPLVAESPQSKLAKESKDEQYIQRVKALAEAYEGLNIDEQLAVSDDVQKIASSMGIFEDVAAGRKLQQLKERGVEAEVEGKEFEVEKQEEAFEAKKAGAEAETGLKKAQAKYYQEGGDDGRQQRLLEANKAAYRSEIEADPDFAPAEKEAAIRAINTATKLPDYLELKNAVRSGDLNKAALAGAKGGIAERQAETEQQKADKLITGLKKLQADDEAPKELDYIVSGPGFFKNSYIVLDKEFMDKAETQIKEYAEKELGINFEGETRRRVLREFLKDHLKKAYKETRMLGGNSEKVEKLAAELGVVLKKTPGMP